MQKVSNVKSIKDLDYKLKTAFDEALKDAFFKEFVGSINLSDEKLMKYTSSLEDSCKEYKNCKTCKSLSACKNSINGHCYLPFIVGDKLDFSYVACKYKNRQIKEDRYLNNVTSIDIPREIKNAKIKDIYTDDKARENVIKWIINYVKDYKKGIIGKGLFLHGSFGCGKTYLISALFNELAKDGVKSVIVYWPEYLRSLKSSFGLSNDEFKDKYSEVKYAKLLLIDDLGAETLSAWSRDEILGTILQYRMQEGLPTFVTSNLNIKELEEHLASSKSSEKVKSRRIIERINQLTIDTEMLGENKRK